MSVLERLLPASGDIVADRYELREEIGRGGFGVVFRATQMGLNEDVALKILLPHVLENEDIAARFEREVIVAKGLRHPNTIRILDYSRTDKGLPFYVMEFVRGSPLDNLLADEGPVSPERSRRIAVQLLKSLAEAHSKGVVHRDLKPANLILTEIYGEEDFLKVLDFGIAKALTNEGGMAQTSTGMVLGTPSYMSPEQALGRKDLDGRSDIYAVGLIIAECLSAEPVVTGETPYLVVAKHASTEPLAFIPGLMSSELWSVITKATAKRREDRYQDATEMRRALLALGPLPDCVSPELSGPHGGAYVGYSQPNITPATPAGMAVSSPIYQEDIDPTAKTVHGLSGEMVLERRHSGARRGLLVLLLLGVIVAGAIFAVARGGRDQAGSPGEPSGLAATNPEPPTRPETPGEMPTEPGTPTVAGPVISSPQAPESRGAARAAFAVAVERVGAAAPITRPVRIEGDGITVRYQGALLGQTPVDLVLPRVPHRIELELDRDGYRPASQSLSLLDDRVEVALERRGRHHEPEEHAVPTQPTPIEPDESGEETSTSPFGQTRIHD